MGTRRSISRKNRNTHGRASVGVFVNEDSIVKFGERAKIVNRPTVRLFEDSGGSTMHTATRIELPTKQIEEFCRKYGVEEFSLFGSVLRDDFGPESDVDVMLKFKPDRGFTFENTPDIQDELEAMFGRPVDVIEKGRIRNPIRRKGIMNSYRVVYVA